MCVSFSCLPEAFLNVCCSFMEHMLPPVQKDPAELGTPKCSKAHYEMTIGKCNSQLGIRKCTKTQHEVTSGNPNSQLGIDKCPETHYEMTTGNFNSQLGIPNWEFPIGNSHSGIAKWEL